MEHAEVNETEKKYNLSRNMIMLLAVIAQQHQPAKAGLYRAWEALRKLFAAPIE